MFTAQAEKSESRRLKWFHIEKNRLYFLCENSKFYFDDRIFVSSKMQYLISATWNSKKCFTRSLDFCKDFAVSVNISRTIVFRNVSLWFGRNAYNSKHSSNSGFSVFFLTSVYCSALYGNMDLGKSSTITKGSLKPVTEKHVTTVIRSLFFINFLLLRWNLMLLLEHVFKKLMSMVLVVWLGFTMSVAKYMARISVIIFSTHRLFIEKSHSIFK